MNLRKLHFPSIGVIALLAGGLLRVVSLSVQGPATDILVIMSGIILLLAVAWILMFDIFPIFLDPFYVIRKRFSRRRSFFFALIVFFAAMLYIYGLLPSGRTKDITGTLAVLGFFGSITWALVVYTATTFSPQLIRVIKRQPREPEKVTFADIVTSMAIIAIPTIALSFIFSPPGLARYEVTPYQVFLTSLLTSISIGVYLYFWVIRPKIFTLRQLGLRRVDRADIGHAFVLFLLVSVIVFTIQAFLNRIGISLNQYSFSTREGAIYALVATVGITPFIEELYFRGFLFRGIQLHNKLWVAYLTSALLFAILHPPLLVMAQAFIIGILLAYVAKETKSIWPGVFLHMLNNALVFGYLLYR